MPFAFVEPLAFVELPEHAVTAGAVATKHMPTIQWTAVHFGFPILMTLMPLDSASSAHISGGRIAVFLPAGYAQDMQPIALTVAS
ncbi:hypothetical protein [Streptomyces sp. NPDC048636]|uniref:hypothetical protein n=1 Tax=Streptomyces sp. NPDC048636 TaxID=3155762 RepID=UPI003448DAAB